MKIEKLPYRPCVGVMLVNRDGLVFIGKRRTQEGTQDSIQTYAWQMPQGGIDKGEEPRDAALRELYEETNVRSVSLIAEAPEWYSYDLPRAVAGKAWKGRYRGQTQKWFALRFEGSENEIDVAQPAGGKHKAEFSDWRWERLDALVDLIVPFKRPVYEKVVAAFTPVVAG